MYDFSTIVGAGISGGVGLLITIITILANSKFKELGNKIDDIDNWNREKHKDLGSKIDKLTEHFSAEQKIMKIATEAKEFVHADDKEMQLFIKSCVDVSLYFYNELTTKNLKNVTRSDIDSCSNFAIATMCESRNRFSKEFINEFWTEFIKKAIDIRATFEEIFKDEFNQKNERFVRAIETYLFDQMKTIIKLRYKRK